MNKKDERVFLEHQHDEFVYKKNKSSIDISFNRIAFIFFIFFMISIIFSIHLLHLGSRKIKIEIYNKLAEPLNNLYRADIVDINGDYIGKTIDSIDVGISPRKIIDQKKLILNLKYIFPNKDYLEVKKKLKKVIFFILKKKFLKKITKS